MLNSEVVRREYLRQGGSASRAARTLETTRQNVEAHVRRANSRVPLVYGQGSPEDRAAVQAYVLSALLKVKVSQE